VAAVVVLADQLTKSWAVSRLSHGPIHVAGPLDFELQRNTGSAFSLFQGEAAVLVVVALILVGALLVMARRAPTAGRAVVFGLILGGALGNLADRLFRGDNGAVIDFVALHVWPTFNVADSCIVVGCVLLVVSLLRGGRSS
jgi:signal peptidase II